MSRSEEGTLAKSLRYSQAEYQQVLAEFAYDSHTNKGKNQFIVNEAYYLSRLKGHRAYKSQTDYGDYYQDELLQIENYDAGAYFLGLGADGYIGKETYSGDYLKGKRVLNHALSQRQLPPQSLRYGTSNWMFPVAVLNYLSSFLGMLLLTLVIGVPFLVKYEGPGVRQILAQPVSRRKILVTDGRLVVSRVALAVTGGLVVSYFLGTLFGQRIPADYPILINQGGQYGTMPLYHYLLSGTALVILGVFFCYLVTQLLVFITKNSIVSLVLTFLLVAFGQAVGTSPNETIKAIAPYVAPLYLSPQKVYTGLDYFPQKKIVMTEIAGVPEDIVKGRESEFSLASQADLSKGHLSPSRHKFFMAQFYPENSSYYAGDSLQASIGRSLNVRNGVWVLLASCFGTGWLALAVVQKKNF